MAKNLLYFSCGALLGAVCGFLGGKILTKKQQESRADEEIERMQVYYEKNYEYRGHRGDSDTGDTERDSDGGSSGGNRGPNRSDVSGSPEGNEEGRSNDSKVQYSKMYKSGSAETDLKTPKKEVIFEEGCDPTAEYEATDENELEAERVEEEDRERRRNQNRRPRIISAEACDDLPSYVQQRLMYYYPETDVMMDEDDHQVENYELYIGDCLEKYGFSDPDNTELVIFIRNYEYDTLYEIQKVHGNDPITEAALEE